MGLNFITVCLLSSTDVNVEVRDMSHTSTPAGKIFFGDHAMQKSKF
jgi:hypothetical protein